MLYNQRQITLAGVDFQLYSGQNQIESDMTTVSAKLTEQLQRKSDL